MAQSAIDPFEAFREFEGAAQAAGILEPAYIDELFSEQRHAFEDDEKRMTCLCTRRSGKTDFVSRKLMHYAETHPDGASVYIALTKGHARRNLGKKLRRLKRQHNIPIRETERDGQLLWIHENGHEIWLAGCKDKSECEKFRGEDEGYGLAIVDEGQSYPRPSKLKVVGRDDDDEAQENRELLEYLVNDVLDPALLDRDGTLIILGTPGVLPIGFFWEVTTGDGRIPKWKTHSWSVFDNPHIPHARQWLENKMAKNGWDWNHPTVQREWMGKWVADRSAIIYQFDPKRNGWWPDKRPDEEEREPWAYLPGDPSEYYVALGIDLGHDDSTAFVLTASRRGQPNVYVLKTWGGSEMTTSQRAAEWRRTKEALEKDRFRLNSTVVDTGGLGKAIVHDLNKDYGVICDAADKRDKAAGIRAVKDAMTGGRLQYCMTTTHQVRSEMSVLPWNDDRTNHHEGYSDHWCDALVYVFRCHPTYETWEKELPEAGTDERANYDADQIRKRMVQDHMLKQRQARARNPVERWTIQSQRNALRRYGR